MWQVLIKPGKSLSDRIFNDRNIGLKNIPTQKNKKESNERVIKRRVKNIWW
jgi:hypothetical protein